MIEVQHLTKRYGPVTAVHDISFRVERGEILGFLGPNGAGKTTTMRILTGYMPATEGKALVAGFDVFEQPLEAKKRTGYLPMLDWTPQGIFVGAPDDVAEEWILAFGMKR